MELPLDLNNWSTCPESRISRGSNYNAKKDEYGGEGKAYKKKTLSVKRSVLKPYCYLPFDGKCLKRSRATEFESGNEDNIWKKRVNFTKGAFNPVNEGSKNQISCNRHSFNIFDTKKQSLNEYTHSEIPDQGTDDIGSWEKHTKGIGTKIMQKMGYIPGMGIGLNLQGIARPVEVTQRRGRGSVGYCRSVQKKRNWMKKKVCHYKRQAFNDDWEKRLPKLENSRRQRQCIPEEEDEEMPLVKPLKRKTIDFKFSTGTLLKDDLLQIHVSDDKLEILEISESTTKKRDADDVIDVITTDDEEDVTLLKPRFGDEITEKKKDCSFLNNRNNTMNKFFIKTNMLGKITKCKEKGRNAFEEEHLAECFETDGSQMKAFRGFDIELLSSDDEVEMLQNYDFEKSEIDKDVVELSSDDDIELIFSSR